MKVFVTKYALSSGIQEVEGELAASTPSMFCQKTTSGWTTYYHGEGKKWHRTKEGALAKAEAMRVAKIASLRKQITKLQEMTFK